MGSTDQAAAQSVTQYRERHSLVREDGDAAAAKARNDTLRERIAGSADFAEVAKEESDDTFSKDNGGELGWFNQDQFGHEFGAQVAGLRSEEQTSELQSLMRTSYAVFCLKKKPTVRRYTPLPIQEAKQEGQKSPQRNNTRT